MSDVADSQHETPTMVEDLQRIVFKECVERTKVESNGEFDPILENVPISVIISYVKQNCEKNQFDRKRNDFLADLRKSLQKVARDDQVNWFEFRESSKRWFLRTINWMTQDGNNNIHLNESDESSEVSRKDGISSEGCSSIDTIEDDYNLSSTNQVENIASCYSLSSNSTCFGTTDTTMDSSEDNNKMIDDLSSIDIHLRLRRSNKENTELKEDLYMSEQMNMQLQKELKAKTMSLDQISIQCTKLRKEVEDQKNILAEAEQRDASYKQDLLRLQKTCNTLKKNNEKLQKESEDILNLKEKIDKLAKENKELTSQIRNYKLQYDMKVSECQELKEQGAKWQSENEALDLFYKKDIEHYKEKCKELQKIIESHEKMNRSDDSSRLSITPPPYNMSNIHSTPYNRHQKFERQDTLFSELKAFGHNPNEQHYQDIEEELSLYKNEVDFLMEQVDEALQMVAVSKHKICAPDVHLIETSSIQSLKHKIMTLIKSLKVSTLNETSPRVRDDSLEKPDVLLETKNADKLDNNHEFTSVEKRDNDLIGSVTSSIPLIVENGVCNIGNNSTSPLTETADSLGNSAVSETCEPEIIIPIQEAVKRINELNGEDDEVKSNTIKRSECFLKPRSIFTNEKPSISVWSRLNEKARQNSTSTATKSTEKCSYFNSNAHGDALDAHGIFVESKNPDYLQVKKIDAAIEMKTVKSEIKECNPSPEQAISKTSMKFVTIRPAEATFTISPLVSSTEATFDNSSFCDPKSTDTYFATPNHNTKPQRKYSVYSRSRELESLETPDSNSNEKKRSSSSPNVQDSEKINYQTTNFETPMNNQLLNAYRSINNSYSSDSLSPQKNESSIVDDDAELLHGKNEPLYTNRTVTLAPTKFKLPDSTVSQTEEFKKPSTVALSVNLKSNLFIDKIIENDEIQQSRILSSSANLKKEETNTRKQNEFAISSTLSNVESDSSKLTVDNLSISTGDNSVDDNSVDYLNLSCSIISSPNLQINDKTYVTKRVKEETRKVGTTIAPSAMSTVISATETNCVHDSNASTVERAMSSGEGSSAESECDARPNEEVKSVLVDKHLNDIYERSVRNNEGNTRRCQDNVGLREDKVQISPIMNGNDKENGYHKVTSNSSPQEVIKEGERPKAFPTWTDEKLQESGIASFPDIDSEINESLSEEDLKKKYTTFSVGLAVDRMTLSKRITLSRRHRDQDEKNFTNDYLRMQQDVKELAPLCIDSESLERVERVKQQLEIVGRCVHRISCSSETLGAVYQERRVSRAVLLADKYLQTLRAKCDKLATELAETKRILAENNIVLEENLSEMGDDVPRVRYRAVPNNNRTMMARRRASIATISRPLMGSNQDITKDLPRQRNSVSGRVPGLRRPSLCYETPKLEIEKLDRTDSASSIVELRDISEHAESRRHSREENNNLIRTSINNLSTIASDHTEEEEDVWSNTQEEITPELVNDNEVNSLELGQHHRHPIICWVMNRYVVRKSIVWGLFVAFLLGFFVNRVLSFSRQNRPPISWWSIEELLDQYIQVENEGHPVPRPI